MLPNTLLTDPLYVLGMLFLIVLGAEILVKHTFFRHLGTALLVILLGALLANLRIIPSASNAIPLYDGLFEYLTPLAIFYLLLGVNLRSIKKAGGSLLLMFFIGSAGTIAGALVGIRLIDQAAFGNFHQAIAGMFTGTYIGGSANFNALALHYNVMKAGNLYAGAVAVDNIISTVWMLVCLAAPVVLNKRWPRKAVASAGEKQPAGMGHEEPESIQVAGLSLLLALGLFSQWVSMQVSTFLQAYHFHVPSIIIITTLALFMAQIRTIAGIAGSRLLGNLGIYVFLALVGSHCELAALGNMGGLALQFFLFTSILVGIHGLIVFGIGACTPYDWHLVSIASLANIGGATTALALAKSFERSDLLIPAVLVGSLGNATGTYLGFLVANLV